MREVKTGLMTLAGESSWQSLISGDIGYLCHSASVTPDLNIGINVIKSIFGDRLKKIFGPQHGFVSDVQDNMVETEHYTHPFFNLPIFSLYSETRTPTKEMLDGIDTIIIDLQDVGTRVYTYASTMLLLMEACGKLDKKVVILDRPNPIDGLTIEGNILEDDYKSFVGRIPIPMRHGMTMGEIALFSQKFHNIECELVVIPMFGWKRAMSFQQTGLPWVLPSPNLPTSDGAYTFAGTVIFEGTNISEGRGTTRSLEIIGHPEIEPYQWQESLTQEIIAWKLEGFTLRPLAFMPTFQKYQGITCGGFQIHVTDYDKFRPWHLAQLLCRELYKKLGNKFEWNKKPYEYELDRPAIDFINGSNKIRKWVEDNGTQRDLLDLENIGMDEYRDKRSQIIIYDQ